MDGNIGELFKNKLFLQYLSGAGMDIAAGNPLSANVNQATQQNISAQNFASLLKMFLDDSDSQMTANSKGLSFNLPPDQAGKMFEVDKSLELPTSNDGTFAVDKSLTSTTTPTSTPTTGGTEPLANPFGVGSAPASNSIGSIDPKMLAGLSPEHIMSALGMKLKQDELGRQSVKDTIDAIYKKALTDEAIARTGDIGKEEKTAAVKNYEYAVSQGEKRSFGEWEKDVRTSNQKDYESAKSGGYTGSFHEWLTDLRKSGATKIDIGTKVTEALKLGSIKGQQYFQNPDWVDDVKDNINKDKELKTKLEDAMLRNKPTDTIVAEASVKYIESKIKAGRGNIEEVKWDTDGKTIVWSVKWPSGQTEEVRYEVGS